MASLLFKANKMKQRLQKSFSCSSAASTSIVDFSSGRAVDRHSPHPRRCLTELPSVPNRSSSSSTSSSTKQKRKKTTMTTATATSPPSSSRFLLDSSRLQLEQPEANVTILDSLPPLPPPSLIDSFPSDQIAEYSSNQQAIIKRSCSAARSRSQHNQAVVLKVSLHCKGCAAKVKKHISKMEGVTSFDIDIATKKVTVMGDVTPLGVLNCISKVKSAQLWPSSPPRASASF